MSTTKTPQISAAEFITLRQACGLTQSAVGEYLGVGLRTVQHWEAARNAISTEAAEKLRALDKQVRDAASAVLAPIARGGRPKRVQLTRYRTPEEYAGSDAAKAGLPFLAYNALLWRVMDGLARLGVPYAIAWPASA